ncbi:MAG: 5-hydroxyisourate hydrolase [Pseudonocardiales bacterium]|jgi:5-hydroxyisourate hydrolase|nr:5-hydroxyisourate hydrolase [Pseudonocardiales bacterium]MDT4941306.1 5-hydroxyisourate hydrolase [Pseudonocardiales bacterium]
MTISTHVLDAALGRPAAGVPVRLEGPAASLPVEAVTDADGRVAELTSGASEPGDYRLRFDTGSYFRAAGRESFYPEVVVTFTITDATQHYHVPLLLSPFAYSTYRGS